MVVPLFPLMKRKPLKKKESSATDFGIDSSTPDLKPGEGRSESESSAFTGLGRSD